MVGKANGGASATAPPRARNHCDAVVALNTSLPNMPLSLPTVGARPAQRAWNGRLEDDELIIPKHRRATAR
jgi:hypothetical protein